MTISFLFRAAFIVVGLSCMTAPASAQPGTANEPHWPPVSDALEACLVEEEKNLTTGHACIGRHARKCLEIAQREHIVHVEKCYAPELAAWARLVNRYFNARPKDAKGKRIAEVQRAWVTYRDLKCSAINSHHGGGDLGRWQSQMCLMEETGRRAIELRAFRVSQAQ